VTGAPVLPGPVKERRALAIGLRWLATVALLVTFVLFARSVEWSSTWQAVRSASLPLIVAATFINLVSLAAHAVAWWVFLRPCGVSSFPLALRATVAGAAINNLVVVNAGEAARVVFVARASGTRISGAVAALAVARLVHIAAFVLLVAAALLLLPMPVEIVRWRWAVLLVLIALAVLVLLLVLRPPPGVRAAAPGTGWIGRLRAWATRFGSALHTLSTPPRLAAAFVLELINWLTQLATYHLTARAVQFPISVAGSVAETITAQLGFMLRVTPGNVGLFQMVYALTADWLGLVRDHAVAVAFLLQALQAIPVTVLGAALAPELVLRSARMRGNTIDHPV
jgi:uncharacterized protein (TIRG00374 family)